MGAVSDLVEGAKLDVDLLVVDGGSWLPLLRESFERAKSRGVRVRVLFVDPSSALSEYLCNVEKELTPGAHLKPLVLLRS